MKVVFTFTQKGWFGFCPVYFAGLDTEAPMVEPRHWSLLPLMILSEWVYDFAFWCARVMNPEFEPTWPLRVTADLTPPLRVERHLKDCA